MGRDEEEKLEKQKADKKRRASGRKRNVLDSADSDDALSANSVYTVLTHLHPRLCSSCFSHFSVSFLTVTHRDRISRDEEVCNTNKIRVLIDLSLLILRLDLLLLSLALHSLKMKGERSRKPGTLGD